MSHTKGPWVINGGIMSHTKEPLVINDQTGSGWMDNSIYIFSDEHANIRRIVACVNACAGFTDEELDGADLCKDSIDGQNEYDAMKKQRDELLAELKDAATSLETIQLRSFGEESYLNHKDQMRGYAGTRAGIARAAIAKAEAQS